MTKVKKDSAAAKAIIEAVGDTSRVVIDADQLDAKLAVIEKAAGDSVPIVFAGNSREETLAAGTTSLLIGIVQEQITNQVSKKTEIFYKTILVAPFWSVEEVQESGDKGIAWLAKISEKEMAHVLFRPIRNADENADLASAAEQVPTSIDLLTESRSRGAIDTTAVSMLWPHVHYLLANAVELDEETGEPVLDDTGQEIPDAPRRLLAAAAPSAGAYATVAKLLRSKSWAAENYPELESEKRQLVTVLGNMMLALAEQELPLGEPEEKGGEPTMIQVDASQIADWLDKRDTVDISPVVKSKPKDFSALDTFITN